MAKPKTPLRTTPPPKTTASATNLRLAEELKRNPELMAHIRAELTRRIEAAKALEQVE